MLVELQDMGVGAFFVRSLNGLFYCVFVSLVAYLATLVRFFFFFFFLSSFYYISPCLFLFPFLQREITLFLLYYFPFFLSSDLACSMNNDDGYES